MENGKLIFDKTYKVFYTDDLGLKRDKILLLQTADNTMYFFYNPRTKKIEAIPQTSINRMEEINR